MIESVIFDFMGTLAVVQEYSARDPVEKMYESLVHDYSEIDYTHFRETHFFRKE